MTRNDEKTPLPYQIVFISFRRYEFMSEALVYPPAQVLLKKPKHAEAPSSKPL